MGFVVTSLTDYTEKATELLRAGVLFNDDMANYSVQPGIKYQEYLSITDFAPYAQAGDCGLATSGDTTFTEKTITVEPIAWRQRFCTTDLRKKALPMAAGTLNGQFAPSMEEHLTTGIIEKIKEATEQDLWLGTGTGLIGDDGGWFANLSACTGAISLDTSGFTGSYAGFAPSLTNIDDIVNDFIDNITDPMWARGVLTLHMSKANFELYRRNRLAANYYYDQNDPELNANMEMWALGYAGSVKIKAEAGLNGSNYMLLTWDKNLYIGLDEMSEVSSAKWVYDEITDYVWFKASYKLGTEIAFCGECVHNMYA